MGKIRGNGNKMGHVVYFGPPMHSGLRSKHLAKDKPDLQNTVAVWRSPSLPRVDAMSTYINYLEDELEEWRLFRPTTNAGAWRLRHGLGFRNEHTRWFLGLKRSSLPLLCLYGVGFGKLSFASKSPGNLAVIHGNMDFK